MTHTSSILSYRSYFKIIATGLICFILFNATIWFCWTRTGKTLQESGGDLVRMGYIVGYNSTRPTAPQPSKRHITPEQAYKANITPDIITIGDSFSLPNKEGNYQDWFASAHNLTIVNIPTTGNNDRFEVIDTLVRALNDGTIEKLRPRYVLLETVEREAIGRLARYINFSVATPKPSSSTMAAPAAANKNIMSFINDGNFKLVLYNLQYSFFDRAYGSKAIIAELTQPFFSSNKSNKLIFYRHDMKAAPQSNPVSIRDLNNNLNALAAILETKGCQLVFMPAPDKLTLYRPFLRNKNKYPESTFFEELRKLPKNYRFIDTKEILLKELTTGSQDLYHQGDTHWTWKAATAISRCVNFP